MDMNTDTKEPSCGLLMYRMRPSMELFLVHPGGPFWAKKDTGVWGIPKGIHDGGEDYFGTACREFTEETGLLPTGPYLDLGTVPRKGRPPIYAWAFETNLAGQPEIASNLVPIVWPPKSGATKTVPEIDRGEFFTVEVARRKIHDVQQPFIDRLLEAVTTG